MDRGFVKKRIKEQAEYIGAISMSKLSKTRKLEIIKSAFCQLKYFSDKLNEFKK